MSGVPLSKAGGAKKFEWKDGSCSEFLLEFVEEPTYYKILIKKKMLIQISY